jgi:hypothetical protein
MRTWRTLGLPVVGLAIVLLVLFRVVNPPAVYSAPKVKPSDVNVLNTHREQVEFFFTQGFGPLITVYTVPPGQKLTLTDAIFNHAVSSNTGVSGANISRGTATGGEDLLRALVVDQQNTVLHFATGYEFFSGEELLYGTGGSGNAVTVSLVGYLTSQ